MKNQNSVDDVVVDFQRGSKKQTLWTGLGFFIAVFVASFLGVQVAVTHYLSALVASHGYSVSVQEWRSVANGIEGGWSGFPDIDKVCFFNPDGVLVYATSKPCVPEGFAGSWIKGTSVSTDKHGIISQITLKSSLWHWVLAVSTILVLILSVIAEAARRLTTLNEQKRLIESLRKLAKPETTPSTDFERLIKAQADEIVTLRRDAEIGKMASQISHDIRSPLAALEMVSKLATQMPEEHRVLVRGAVGRIRDIANNLLQKHKALPETSEGNTPAAKSEAALSVQLIPSIVDSIVSEKRLEHRAKMGIEIQAALESSYGLFAYVDLTEFKRVLSNLVNNAVEVLGEKGIVMVGVDSDEDDRVVIFVRDNGRGIAPEVLVKLGRRGISVGKKGTESGSGLGLYHARTTVESWGGSFAIDSPVGAGTTVRLILPRAPAPQWFLPDLRVRAGMTVVVLDDDDSIHGVWRERFATLEREHGLGLELKHISTPQQLKEFVRTLSYETRCLYLVDFELIGFKETGLDVIEQCGIKEDAVLVTSRFEETAVRERCEKLGVRLLPKGMASTVPIRMG